jgi:DNA-binding NtrC family response regulator
MLANAVIVVDDEQDMVDVMTQTLEKEGYQVHGFTDPVNALAHAKDCKECDTIVSDIRIPGMNGIQLVRAVKKLRPDMKVVLTTAFEIDKNEWQQVLPSTEVDAFVTKPFRMLKLVEVIQRIQRCTPQTQAELPSDDFHSILGL